jgi:hypothetical protein
VIVVKDQNPLKTGEKRDERKKRDEQKMREKRRERRML